MSNKTEFLSVGEIINLPAKKNDDVDYDPWIDEPLTDEEQARLNALSLKDAVDW
jgi:hypothetical protein